MSALRWGMSACVLMVLVLFLSSAQAGLEVLPTSTHYQGLRLDGDLRIEFAVYDSQGGNEFAQAGFAAPGEGRYTYVYQLFNQNNGVNGGVEHFQVSGIGLGAVTTQEQIGSADDLAGGIAATGAYFDASLTKGAWEFENGTLVVGKHSVFLIISSDNDWVAGQYTIQLASDIPVPGGDDNEIPEPATLIFTALGGLALLGRRGMRS